MAKTKISEWSSTPANNTDIDSINIAEGCAPSGINDAIRELMSQVKDLYSGTTGDVISVAGGGTGIGTLTGLVKGNGTSAFSAATAGTDYVTPTGTETLTNKTLTAPIIDNPKLGYTTTATAAGTTTLTATSNHQQLFTGTTTQTIVLPVTSTLALGMSYSIENNSTGVLTVQSSGLNSITTIPAGVTTLFTCILTSGTTAASWDYDQVGFATITGTGDNVLATSPTLVTPLLGTPTSGNFSTGTFTWPTFNQNTSGTAAGLSATLAVASGGTGQTSYTNGQLLIGNTTGNTLTKATLTAGTGITITNGAGSISIASSGGSAATPTALGTVYGSMTTSGGTPFLTALGYNAGVNTTGTHNTAVGVSALQTNSSGNYNSALGFEALKANTTANFNTAVGYIALASNTTATANTAVGFQSLQANTTGGTNTSVGYTALFANTTGTQNTAVGSGALSTNTTSSRSTAVGLNALNLSTAADNTAMGFTAGANISTGYSNTAIGSYALNANTSATNNVALGYQALYSVTTGSRNVAVGSGTGAVLTGSESVFIGHNAGASVTTGSNNILIGNLAGQYQNAITTGSNNVVLSYAGGIAAGTDSNEILINTVYNGSGKGSNTGFINPNGGGVYQGNNSSSWSTTSDQRLKKNIVDNNIGLEKLTQIQVRNFEYRVESEITELPTHAAIKKEGVQLGVIAQELQAVLPDCVKQESTGVLSVDTDNLTWYLINAVKELSARVKQLEGN